MNSWVKIFIRRLVDMSMKNVAEQIAATRFSNQLTPLFTNWAYLPLTNWAAGPEFLCHVANEICINRRRNIVEFGSGISTLLLARLAKLNNINLKISTIDKDLDWQMVIKKIAEQDKIAQYIEFIYNKIINGVREDIFEIQKKVFIKEEKFDCVLVDGPASGFIVSRFDAVPIIKKFLAESFVIFLHDTDREEERQIIKDWAMLLPGVTLSFFPRYAMLSSHGQKFDSVPQSLV